MSVPLLSAAETAWIGERALALGLDACGVATAEKFPELRQYPEWLGRGYAGQMKYLQADLAHIQERLIRWNELVQEVIQRYQQY